VSQRIRAIILDWAGTTVDFGARAPALACIEIFRRRGIEITVEETRGPMGRSKREHIFAVAGMPRVAALWRRQFSREPSEVDIDNMYDDFLPLLKRTIASTSAVIPGVPEATNECRRRGLKIGSTTGYTREIMDVIAPLAAKQGYAPDVVICSDEVAAGRPTPWMNFRAAEALGVYPMSAVLIVDDTPVGIEAARHAGGISVAVTQTGNALGLSELEAAALDPQTLETKLKQIEQMFRNAGADHVLRSVADIPLLLC
jgi:phosphonoacetaldehyde hydrolase